MDLYQLEASLVYRTVRTVTQKNPVLEKKKIPFLPSRLIKIEREKPDKYVNMYTGKK